MKPNHLLTLALAAISCLCANAKEFSQSWTQPISTIVVNGSAGVRLAFSSAKEATATYSALTEESPYTFKLRNGVLEIAFVNNININGKKVTDVNLNLNSPVKKIVINGSGDVTANTLNTPGNLELRVEGSGDIDIKSAKANNIAIEISGSGDINIYQLTGLDIQLNLRGSGDIDIKSISARALNANLAGSGDIALGSGTAKSLRLSLTGSGDIDSRINASTSSVSLNGSGDIKCLSSNEMEITNANTTGDITVRGAKPKILSTQGKHIHFK